MADTSSLVSAISETGADLERISLRSLSLERVLEPRKAAGQARGDILF